jgi:LPXTG-site transpeptidase (sortase) family protein
MPEIGVTQDQTVDTPSLKTQKMIDSPVLPIRLTIPSLYIQANIYSLGITPEGVMEIPNNSYDVGWFGLGSRPGEKGSAVITGHFDGKKGEPGVFFLLNSLRKGDKVVIENDNGTSTTFLVRESKIFNPGYAEEVFNNNDTAHLNLVTCDGLWDGSKKSYSKRLVVFTDIK